MENNLKQTGTLTKLWGAHGKFTKYLSIGGLLLTTAILPLMAVGAKASDPSAGLLDIGTHFYSSAFNIAAENFAPGWGIILNETFKAVASITTEVFVPGSGAVLNTISPAI